MESYIHNMYIIYYIFTCIANCIIYACIWCFYRTDVLPRRLTFTFLPPNITQQINWTHKMNILASTKYSYSDILYTVIVRVDSTSYPGGSVVYMTHLSETS